MMTSKLVHNRPIKRPSNFSIRASQRLLVSGPVSKIGPNRSWKVQVHEVDSRGWCFPNPRRLYIAGKEKINWKDLLQYSILKRSARKLTSPARTFFPYRNVLFQIDLLTGEVQTILQVGPSLTKRCPLVYFNRKGNVVFQSSDREYVEIDPCRGTILQKFDSKSGYPDWTYPRGHEYHVATRSNVQSIKMPSLHLFDPKRGNSQTFILPGGSTFHLNSQMSGATLLTDKPILTSDGIMVVLTSKGVLIFPSV